MNQRGNEPMTTLHARIPCELMQWLDDASNQAGVSKSEFIRLALEYVQAGNVSIVSKVIYKPTSERN